MRKRNQNTAHIYASAERYKTKNACFSSVHLCDQTANSIRLRPCKSHWVFPTKIIISYACWETTEERTGEGFLVAWGGSRVYQAVTATASRGWGWRSPGDALTCRCIWIDSQPRTVWNSLILPFTGLMLSVAKLYLGTGPNQLGIFGWKALY